MGALGRGGRSTWELLDGVPINSSGCAIAFRRPWVPAAEVVATNAFTTTANRSAQRGAAKNGRSERAHESE
jgi:hypothetical protein